MLEFASKSSGDFLRIFLAAENPWIRYPVEMVAEWAIVFPLAQNG
jgi:hypothetical protein